MGGLEMDERIRRWVVGAVGMLVMALVASPARAGSEVVVGRPCAAAERASIDQVDHAPFDALLRRYVDDGGLVDYGRWKATPADVAALESYLARLGCVDLKAPARREARLAFWINAYNALTLDGILREYPTSSIRNHTARFGGYNIWKDLKVVVDGRPHSLDDVEHAVLRKMDEPRIHLALVCASRGCPPLSNRAYTAAALDAQLTANGRRFLADPRNFRADARSRTVHLSKLFEWYGADFGAGPAEQLGALGPMLPPGSEWVGRGTAARVKYLDYDWSLNERRPARR